MLTLLVLACGRDKPAQQAIQPPAGTATSPDQAPDSSIDDRDSLGATVTLYDFAEAGGTGTIPVLGAPQETVADMNQGAVLLGSVGPLAFVKTWVWAYTCGAHGNTTAAFATLDLARGGPVVLVPDSERAAIEREFRAAASLALVAEDSADADSAEAGAVAQGGVFNPDSNTLTMLIPKLGGPRLQLDYQFSAEACYACGDGDWSGYTRSVRLPARELPQALRAVADVPPEVRAYFRSEPPDTAAGWSAVTMPAEGRDALARLFGVTAPAGGPEFLVWRNTGAFQTVWLRGRGAEATVVGRRPGVWIVAGRKAWTWRERQQRITTVPCERQ